MAGRKKIDRPYRIHDEKVHLDIPHRAYVKLPRAIERALGMMYWMEVGNTYTVYHEPSGKAILQITAGVDEFKFYYDEQRIRSWLQSLKPSQENVKAPGKLFSRG